MRCPYLALFGACDTLVPVEDSVHLIGQTLAVARHPDCQIVVFPDADHGIRLVDGHQQGSPAPHRAPGFFELIVAWLTQRLRTRHEVFIGT